MSGPHPPYPRKGGIQGHTHQSRLPPWTPDHVRGDDVSKNVPSPWGAQRLEGGARWKHPPYSASFETALSRLLRMRMGPPIPVIPAQAGIQSHKHQSHPPPWTPDHVRADEVSDKCSLTLRSAASRRGSPL